MTPYCLHYNSQFCFADRLKIVTVTLFLKHEAENPILISYIITNKIGKIANSKSVPEKFLKIMKNSRNKTNLFQFRNFLTQIIWNFFGLYFSWFKFFNL